MTYHKIGTRHAHRVIAERMIGRKLLPGEVVHHVDGDVRNNDPANLQVLPSQADHARLHFKGQKRKPAKKCKRGHALAGANVEITSIGRRRCVTCRRAYDNKWKRDARRARGLKRPGRKPA